MLSKPHALEAGLSTLSIILEQIDMGTVLLPEFQRGYVWNREQVRGLMRSLYRNYPVGSLLVWETETKSGSVRGSEGTGGGVKTLLLDGQQRITSLYGIARGRPPAFFEGDQSAFTGLRFNVETEVFEFYAPAKMKGDPRWVDVTALFRDGLQPQVDQLNAHPSTAAKIVPYMTRLIQLHNILQRQFHQEKITGADKTVDVVVDIFNKVNSGGTKLSKGDLALAKKCAEWPEARATMREHLAAWAKADYNFSLDWLLRNVTAVVSGRASFEALDSVDADQFAQALTASREHIGRFLDTVSGRLGLDHNRVLMGRYAIPVVSRFLHLSGGSFSDSAQTDRMLFWYIHAALWGRFAGSTETVLSQDYETLTVGGINALIDNLARWRGGNLTIDAGDFEGFGRGSRFYPLLYLLTRVLGARDLCSNLELRRGMLGHLTSLQVHHIFPKAVLYQNGFGRAQVNAVANFCFLTQQCNLAIGMQEPAVYFPKVREKSPGALESQWIPMDEALWHPDRYLEFLAARRELLAEAANDFLAELRHGTRASKQPLERIVVSDEELDDTRVEAVKALVVDLAAQGYTPPETDAEITDPDTGELLAVAEAVWQDGLQAGLGDPVVLELDTTDTSRLEALGYKVFTSVDSLREYVARRTEELAVDGENPTAADTLSGVGGTPTPNGRADA